MNAAPKEDLMHGIVPGQHPDAPQVREFCPGPPGEPTQQQSSGSFAESLSVALSSDGASHQVFHAPMANPATLDFSSPRSASPIPEDVPVAMAGASPVLVKPSQQSGDKHVAWNSEVSNRSEEYDPGMGSEGHGKHGDSWNPVHTELKAIRRILENLSTEIRADVRAELTSLKRVSQGRVSQGATAQAAAISVTPAQPVVINVSGLPELPEIGGIPQPPTRQLRAGGFSAKRFELGLTLPPGAKDKRLPEENSSGSNPGSARPSGIRASEVCQGPDTGGLIGVRESKVMFAMESSASSVDARRSSVSSADSDESSMDRRHSRHSRLSVDGVPGESLFPRSMGSCGPKSSEISDMKDILAMAQKKLHPEKEGFRNQIIKLVESHAFGYVATGLVVTNAITIGVQTDYMAKELIFETPVGFWILDMVYCGFFAFELSLRMIALGSNFFCAADGTWNLFDFLLVVMQVTHEILTYLIKDAVSWMNTSFLRVLRALRLVRVMRIIRVLRLISELRTIVASIMGSMRSLMWTVLLLFVLVYVFAVYLTQMVLDYRATKQNQVSSYQDDQLKYFFGTLPRSMISLYQAISGGIDWDDLAEPLMSRISVMLGFVIVTYTALIILALMNVVTGVFVETALESAKSDRTAYMLEHVKQLFANADPENTGKIGWDRFEANLDKKFMQEFFQAIDVDISDAESVFALLDTDDSGEIDLDEFLNGCLGLHGPSKAIHLATLMYEARITSRFLCSSLSHIAGMLQQVLQAVATSQGKEPVEVKNDPAVDRALTRRRSYMGVVNSDAIDAARRQSVIAANNSGRRASTMSTQDTENSASGNDTEKVVKDLRNRRSFSVLSSQSVDSDGHTMMNLAALTQNWKPSDQDDD